MSILAFLILVLISPSFATVTAGHADCPTQFEGRAQEIIEAVGPDSAFARQTVIFTNKQTLKGEVAAQIPVEVLKHGPIEVIKGEDYLVQLRNGQVCWIESL